MSGGFRTVIDGGYLEEDAHRLRWRRTVGFVARSGPGPSGMRAGLDLGDRTPLSGMLEAHFGCPFHSTSVDLDCGVLEGDYEVVTAFEVLEHLFNPLHALLEVRRLMRGPEARLFVSMPLERPPFLRSPDHFHEMALHEALALFGRAGFRVVRREAFRIRRPLFYLTGLRPALRFFFEKIGVYELVVAR